MEQKFFIKKSFFVLLAFFVLISLFAGFFLWKADNFKTEAVYTDIVKKEIVSAENYNIIENNKGRFVENKNEGLLVKIPDKWIAKGYIEEFVILSPETQFKSNGEVNLDSFKNNNACGFSIEIEKTEKIDKELETDDEYLKNEIDLLKKGMKEENENFKAEAVKIGDKDGLKQTGYKNGRIITMEIRIPLAGAVYIFNSGLIFNEKCADEFNKIVSDISINK